MLKKLKSLLLSKRVQGNILLVAIGLVALCILLVLIITVKRNEENVALKQGEIKRLIEYQQQLRKEFEKETKLRETLRYNDSITIAHLKRIKKRDSLTQVQTIGFLLRKIRTLSDEELDKELLKAYEESINNSAIPLLP